MFFVLLLSLCAAHAQPNFEIDESRKRVTIPFRLVRNMVVVQLKINNKGPFNFVMDTGVGFMIITDTVLIDSLNISSKHLIKVSGLGRGEGYEAYVTSTLKVTVPGIEGNNISAAILKKDHFGLSNYAGIPIHGLLGYDFFHSFAVKINFNDSTLTVGKLADIRIFRKAYRLPISIEDHKPYITTKIKVGNEEPTDCKLIIDLGAGHPLLLENYLDESHTLPQKCIAASLGIGLTGPINGYLSRVYELTLGKYTLKDVITSFPDYTDIETKTDIKRDGNLGIDILKKFNMIFDYQSGALYLKPNLNFKKPFEHDMTGLEYYADGADFKHIIISRVDPGSAADDIGLEKGDEITSINFKSVDNMTVEEIDNLFQSANDRSLYIEILHQNQNSRHVILTLKKRI